MQLTAASKFATMDVLVYVMGKGRIRLQEQP